MCFSAPKMPSMPTPPPPPPPPPSPMASAKQASPLEMASGINRTQASGRGKAMLTIPLGGVGGLGYSSGLSA
jgi:hypothetical protein